MSASPNEKLREETNSPRSTQGAGTPYYNREELRREFKRLKDLRNYHHMDEPDFDDAVMSLFSNHLNATLQEIIDEAPDTGAPSGEYPHDDILFGRSSVIAAYTKLIESKKR